jgi:hypothetical protein
MKYLIDKRELWTEPIVKKLALLDLDYKKHEMNNICVTNWKQIQGC